jgi:hypothetical protein
VPELIAELFTRAVAVAVQHEMKKKSPGRDLAVVTGPGFNHEGA